MVFANIVKFVSLEKLYKYGTLIENTLVFHSALCYESLQTHCNKVYSQCKAIVKFYIT